MAQGSGVELTYRHAERVDTLDPLHAIWLGVPADKNQMGNLRGIYRLVDLTGIPAGTEIQITHFLADTPIGFVVVGTPTTGTIVVIPTATPWDANFIYIKAPNDTNTQVMLGIWAGDARKG